MTGATARRTSAPSGTCVLDHVAIRVTDRDALAAELIDALDIQEIERTDRLTLLGPSFTAGKITLLDAPAGCEPNASRIISLVLAAGAGRAADAPLVLSCGLVITFQGAADTDDDARIVSSPRHGLIGIALRSDDPPITATLLEAEYGMRANAIGSDSASLTCGDSASGGGLITLVRERAQRTHTADASIISILDHIGIRVDDARAWHTYAERAGLAIERWVDAAHSRATFLNGPDDLLIEYVEQTASMGDA